MRSCPECADLYPDDMRFCPLHGTELGSPGAAPAWERTTEHNPVLRAPDTARNLAAPTAEELVDTHPSGRLHEVPRITVSMPLDDAARGIPPPATLPQPRPRAGRRLGLALAVALGLIATSAAAVVGGWYAWRSTEKQRVAAAPITELPPPQADPSPTPPPVADVLEEPAAEPAAEPAPAAPTPAEPSAEPPAPARAVREEPGSQNENRAKPAQAIAESIEPDRELPPSPTPATSPADGPPPARPAVAPTGPVRLGPTELSGRARKRAEPKYPDKLREKGVRGTVVVEVVVDTKGKVSSARAVSGPKELQKHALKAARKWKFSPNNQEISGTLRFTFQ